MPTEIGLISPLNYEYIPFAESHSMEDGMPEVLGVLKGDHFVPDGESRNGRFYEEELWKGVLGNTRVKEAMGLGQVIGTIGHDLEFSEEAFREGKFSHYTKNMQIITRNGERQGYAESYVMDTPVGRVLHGYLKGGVKLFVSSRADGKYKEGVSRYSPRLKRNIPVVDPKKYKFERFDVVLQPGFLKAKPEFQSVREGLDEQDLELFESLMAQSSIDEVLDDFELAEQQANEQSKNRKSEKKPAIPSRYDDSLNVDDEKSEQLGGIMPNEVENQWQKVVERSDQDLTKLDERVSGLTKENENLRTLNTQSEADKTEAYESITALEESNKEFREKLDAFEAVGTVEEFQKFSELGDDPTETEMALKESIRMMTEYKEFFSQHGSMNELEIKLSEQEEELKEWHKLAETPAKCEESLKAAMEKLQEHQEVKDQDTIAKVAETYGVEVDAVKKVHEDFEIPIDKLEEAYASISGNKPTGSVNKGLTQSINESRNKGTEGEGTCSPLEEADRQAREKTDAILNRARSGGSMVEKLTQGRMRTVESKNRRDGKTK